MTNRKPVMAGMLQNNRILDTDSYKLSHAGVYPHGLSGLFSYGEARTKNDPIVFFGLQMWLMKNWTNPLEMWEIDEAEGFAKAHGLPFDRAPWEKVINVYGGFPPVHIRALPEGTVTKSGIPLYSVECTDPDLMHLATYLETSMLRGIWYPTTIASNDLRNYRILKRYLNDTADTKDSLPFMLHDFGSRGVSSGETAEVGGCAHLVYFTGSDTVMGVRAANFYYQCPMAAWSVPASEHSVQTAYGSLNQADYINAMLDRYAKPGAILSIVLDGYDTYREAGTMCSDPVKQKILDSGAKVVFRPDSGDPLEVVPRLLDMQAAAYGYTVNSKGYKVIKTVGILQGDGIDTQSMEAILSKITEMGYSAQNIVFGSGGGLLQKVNRDTYAFAQKASAVQACRTEQWLGIRKDPVTDHGKKSKAGRVTAVRNRVNGEWGFADLDKAINAELEDMHSLVWDTGSFVNGMTTLEQVRARAKEPIYTPA